MSVGRDQQLCCTPLFEFFADNTHFVDVFVFFELVCQMKQTSSDAILVAELCCLSAGRDTASISDKKCDRPRGEGAERVKPTVCILDAEAKALSA